MGAKEEFGHLAELHQDVLVQLDEFLGSGIPVRANSKVEESADIEGIGASKQQRLVRSEMERTGAAVVSYK